MLLDVPYLLAALVTAPIWLFRMARRGRLRTDWAGRLGRVPPIPEAQGRSRILIHAVSVGEVNAIRRLVDALAGRPEPPEIVVSVTTDTGFARARSLFAGRHVVVRYPFDLSWAVSRFLEAVQPDAVVLVELEVWPNFASACARRGIPVGVVNGRLSARSERRYRWIASLVRPMFRRLSFVAAQTEAYAARFRRFGVPADRVRVTGTMKWDTARIEPDRDAAAALAAELGIDRQRPLVVAGSTAPGEHELLHEAVPASSQLLCAPRRPEWFDQAASALPGCARRSTGARGDGSRFLLDSIGELRHAYALADVVVVGRSFGSLHGSDMMEPVGLGRPTIVGPAVSDFQDTVDVLLDAGAIIQVGPEELPDAIRGLLESGPARARLVEAAGRAIEQQSGATERNLRLIDEYLP